METEAQREKKRKRWREYNQSERGKARQKKYADSKKGKEVRKKYNEEYCQTEEGKANRKKYRRSEKGKEVAKAISKRIRETISGKIKCRCRRKLNIEIRAGRIKRLPCEVCGNVESHGHHEDYREPLEVRWFCAKCHDTFHRESGNTPSPPGAEE